MKIQQGERLKLGYGFAWLNYESMTSETFLVPFNIIFRKVRELYIFLARGKGAVLEAYQEGRRQGIAEMTESSLKNQKHFTDKGIQVGWDLFNEMFQYRNLPKEEYYKKADELKENLLKGKIL